MAILSTGFGKSMIITVFALAKEEMSSLKTCVILISPLNSIIDDPISKMLLLSCTAIELNYDGNCKFKVFGTHIFPFVFPRIIFFWLAVLKGANPPHLDPPPPGKGQMRSPTFQNRKSLIWRLVEHTP